MSSPPRKKSKIMSQVESTGNGCGTESGMLAVFRGYSSELSAQQERHERLFKTSRDLTVLSKGTIFLLQRVRLDDDDSCSKVTAEAEKKLKNAAGELLGRMANELHDAPRGLYDRAFSPGMQEYVEAASLLHFIREGTLISRSTCESYINSAIEAHHAANDAKAPIHLFSLSVDDYLLGITDIGGELMRLAINSASSGNREAPFQICAFVRSLYEEVALLENVCQIKGVHNKMTTLHETVIKLEQACYSLKIRGAEVPVGRVGDLFKGSAQAQRQPEER